MAESFELVDESAAVAFGGFGVAAVEELFAELVVGDALLEDVVGGGEDLVGGGDRGFGVAAAALDPVVAGGQVGALGAHYRLSVPARGVKVGVLLCVLVVGVVCLLFSSFRSPWAYSPIIEGQ